MKYIIRLANNFKLINVCSIGAICSTVDIDQAKILPIHVCENYTYIKKYIYTNIHTHTVIVTTGLREKAKEKSFERENRMVVHE